MQSGGGGARRLQCRPAQAKPRRLACESHACGRNQCEPFKKSDPASRGEAGPPKVRATCTSTLLWISCSPNHEHTNGTFSPRYGKYPSRWPVEKLAEITGGAQVANLSCTCSGCGKVTLARTRSPHGNRAHESQNNDST